MDIKEKVVTFTTGGSFSSSNRLMDVPQSIISTTGQYKSGKLIDITLVIDGNDKKPSLDLIFFPEEPMFKASVGSKLDLSFSQLKCCSGRIQILSDDFADVGGCSIANLFNLNMTFLVKEMYMIAVYQGDKLFNYTENSISLSIGYELGNCG
jgi:hypothetical protein